MLVDELRGHGLVTLVYEIKTYEKVCGLFGQIYMYENLHQ